MSYCNTCGIYFDGRGSHCTLHSPYTRDYHNQYPGDYLGPAPIRYRNSHHRHRKQRQSGYHDKYEALEPYNPKTTLARYVHGGHQLVWAKTPNPITHSTSLRPITTTFTHLADTHSIASLTYSVSPTGGHSITATANLDREQCPVCLQYFPDRHHLDRHTWEFPVGCEKHRLCMREEEVAWHAQSKRHERCFVRNCERIYRKEGGWRGSVIEDHVMEWHG